MLRTSSHETFDRDMRCFYNTQLSMAREESNKSTEQKRYDSCNLIKITLPI
jgi:hypothetical protein